MHHKYKNSLVFESKLIKWTYCITKSSKHPNMMCINIYPLYIFLLTRKWKDEADHHYYVYSAATIQSGVWNIITQIKHLATTTDIFI